MHAKEVNLERNPRVWCEPCDEYVEGEAIRTEGYDINAIYEELPEPEYLPAERLENYSKIDLIICPNDSDHVDVIDNTIYQVTTGWECGNCGQFHEDESDAGSCCQ